MKGEDNKGEKKKGRETGIRAKGLLGTIMNNFILNCLCCCGIKYSYLLKVAETSALHKNLVCM